MLTGTPFDFDSRGCDTHMCAFNNADPLDFFTQQGRSMYYSGVNCLFISDLRDMLPSPDGISCITSCVFFLALNNLQYIAILHFNLFLKFILIHINIFFYLIIYCLLLAAQLFQPLQNTTLQVRNISHHTESRYEMV